MGKIYSVCNFKGGCGKTSTALNLGAALVESGKSAILIDSDAQGNLTVALGYTPIEQPRALANLLLAAIDYPEDLDFHLQKAIIHTDTGIDLIPANRRLADAAARLQVMQLSQYNAVGDAERPIEYSIKVAECPAAGQSIFDYASKNAAAESYRSLAEEVLRLA